ncbi:hypothetical protein BT63DRAFT_424411 [Microthyrium microscopicum]|uniref:Uncharacterized protein n=1 Tax=Microthyrium microscopicum TaxID=703497 RepID=A0A6A6UGA7_9PEZI|nr:hypothetical protein BT63DRAFT_424411 [Microthyrium microscopicum]
MPIWPDGLLTASSRCDLAFTLRLLLALISSSNLECSLSHANTTEDPALSQEAVGITTSSSVKSNDNHSNVQGVEDSYKS